MIFIVMQPFLFNAQLNFHADIGFVRLKFELVTTAFPDQPPNYFLPAGGEARQLQIEGSGNYFQNIEQ